MAGRFKPITIGNETYNLPLSGSSAPWGEELSDLIEALADGLSIVQGPQDISESSAPILNTAGEKDITGLAFNSAEVRSIEISYNISRKITKAVSTIPTGTGVQTIVCSDKHDLFTGDMITVANSNSTPAIDGVYTVTKIDDTSFSIDYGVITVTVAGTSADFEVELLESGTLLANYGIQGWALTQYGVDVGASKTVIDINSSGQGTYNPEVLEGTSHSGLIKFIAKSLLDT